MIIALIKTNAIYNFINNKHEFTEEIIRADAEEIFNMSIYGINKH